MTYKIKSIRRTSLPARDMSVAGLNLGIAPARRVVSVRVRGAGRYAGSNVVSQYDYEYPLDAAPPTDAEIRARVERSSREDLAAWRAGD